MPSLHEVQKAMKIALHSGEVKAALLDGIVSDTVSSKQRLQVYQNNYVYSLTENLTSIFPIVNTFVGEDFMGHVCWEFIKKYPPSRPALQSYGDRLPVFLKNFEPAQNVPYVADIALLEWSVHTLQHKPPVSVDPNSKTLNPHIRVIKSKYPLMKLWLAGIGQLKPEAVSLQEGPQTVCIVLSNHEVRIVSLNRDEESIVSLLQGGGSIASFASDELASLIKKDVIL
ncbi:HvfC/BufC N-terminal domain-containing protein [Kordiimonas pumila]|uniref:DNA-binding domain-containing protein n=1 Tax=Kordiimonas pumila TaxID=2161677 RepID=A0ABV7D258_9PROT|nr:DNA-binding domain-containing protein [Kordiimonas pumila]